jgi:hypothetical protein
MINEAKHFSISIFITLMQLSLLSLEPTNYAILGYEARKKMKQKNRRNERLRLYIARIDLTGFLN